MGVGRLSTEGVGRERARDLSRHRQHEVGERIARARGARRVLGREAVEGPNALVLLAVREVRQPAADLRPGLEDVAAPDQGDVVGPLQDLQVLGLRTLVEGGSAHVAVAAPGEVREGAHDARTAGLLEALDPCLLIEVRPQAERLQLHHLRQVAEAELVQERRAEGARHRRDDVLAAGVKVRLVEGRIRKEGRAQGRAGIVHAVVVEAIADEDLVLLGEALVDPERDLVRIQVAFRGPRIVARPYVRIRYELGEVDRLRRQAAGGDHVAGKRLAGERVVDPVPDAAEVAPLHGGRGDGQVDRQLPALAGSFVAQEEERLPLHERAPEGAPELVPVELLLLPHEEVRGVEPVVAQELEEATVELAAAGLGGDVQHASRLAELGGVGALLDLELLEGVDGGLDVGAALMVVGDVHPVDLERELAAPHAADGGAVDEVRADRHHAGSPRQAGGPRSQARQLVEAATVEGQVDDLGVRHVVAEGARFGVEEGSGGGHLRGLRHRSDGELHVHADGLPDRDPHRVDHGGLEARQGDRHPVEAGVDRRHHVVPAVVRGHVQGLAGGRRGHGDRGLGDGGLLCVSDRAHDAPRLHLRPGRHRQGRRQEQGEPGHRRPISRRSVRRHEYPVLPAE